MQDFYRPLDAMQSNAGKAMRHQADKRRRHDFATERGLPRRSMMREAAPFKRSELVPKITEPGTLRASPFEKYAS